MTPLIAGCFIIPIGGGNFFLMFTPILGKSSNLMSIFFGLVEATNHKTSRKQIHIPPNGKENNLQQYRG